MKKETIILFLLTLGALLVLSGCLPKVESQDTGGGALAGEATTLQNNQCIINTACNSEYTLCTRGLTSETGKCSFTSTTSGTTTTYTYPSGVDSYIKTCLESSSCATKTTRPARISCENSCKTYCGLRCKEEATNKFISCSDSDATPVPRTSTSPNDDLKVKGITKLIEFGVDPTIPPKKMTDLCLSTTKVQEFSCLLIASSTGRVPLTVNTKTWKINKEEIICPSGLSCVDGACICGNGVKDPTENCRNCAADAGCTVAGERCMKESPTSKNYVCRSLCGNGVVNPGENCVTCPADVVCATGQSCTAGACVPLCGNGVVDSGETCSSCPIDVTCSSGQTCSAGVCTAPPAATQFCVSPNTLASPSVCVGSEKLPYSVNCSRSVSDPSTCCVVAAPTSTTPPPSCDGKFLVIHNETSCGIRELRQDCSEAPLSPDGLMASTCFAAGGSTYGCNECGKRMCEYTYGAIHFFSKQVDGDCPSYTGYGYTTNDLGLVSGPGCEVTSACTDSDGGDFSATYGEVTAKLSQVSTGRSATYRDACAGRDDSPSSTALQEYTCVGGSVKRLYENCLICRDGACR